MNSPPSFLSLYVIVSMAILMPRRREVAFPGAVLLLVIAVIAFVLGIYGLNLEVRPVQTNATTINASIHTNVSVHENKTSHQNSSITTPLVSSTHS